MLQQNSCQPYFSPKCQLDSWLLIGRGQTSIAMRVSTRLSGTEFTFLSHLGATGWAPHSQCLFFGDFHPSIMRDYLAARMVNFDQCSASALGRTRDQPIRAVP